MEVVSFQAKNYRSISHTSIEISDYTVIVGPNNQGKSNLLRALVVALGIFVQQDTKRARMLGRYSSSAYPTYSWEDDIPTSMANNDSARTFFRLNIRFSDEEKREFFDLIGSRLNSDLIVNINLGKRDLSFDFTMPGPGKEKLMTNLAKVAKFVKERLDFHYIPCVRTAELANEVVESLLSRELLKLEGNEDYQAAVTKVRELQRPIVAALQKSVTATIKEFVPDVSEVVLDSVESFRRGYRSQDIQINDGNLTSLDMKGDGIKSLVAISLMRHAAENTPKKTRNILFMVEEPESHLHPNAIHGLRKVLQETASKYKLIISTHSPLLINRRLLKSNIIVDKGQAKECRRISEIREILGVTVQDNLVGAKIIVVVEGTSDRVILEHLLKLRDPDFEKHLDDGTIVFDDVGGASKSVYKADLYKKMLIDTLVVVDNDGEGSSAANEILGRNILETGNIFLLKGKGLTQSELEDFIDPVVYRDILRSDYRVDVDDDVFKKTNSKWSDRIVKLLDNVGIVHNAKTLVEIKTKVATACTTKDNIVLNYREGPIESLLKTISSRLR